MSWTNFREKHLFSINLALVTAFVLWQIRKDFYWHPVIVLWLIMGIFVPAVRSFEKKAMMTIGKINGTILLSVFYFLFFTPFSFFYRWFFRNQSFRVKDSTFEKKESISSFHQPF